MATYNKFSQFVEDLNNGVHNMSSDQLVVALSNTQPVAANSVLADIAEISYTNLDSRLLNTLSSGQTGGTYSLVLEDLVLTASGTVPTFQFVAIYNDIPTSPADPLVNWYEATSPIDMVAPETFTINFGDQYYQLT